MCLSVPGKDAWLLCVKATTFIKMSCCINNIALYCVVVHCFNIRRRGRHPYFNYDNYLHPVSLAPMWCLFIPRAKPKSNLHWLYCRTSGLTLIFSKYLICIFVPLYFKGVFFHQDSWNPEEEMLWSRWSISKVSNLIWSEKVWNERKPLTQRTQHCRKVNGVSFPCGDGDEGRLGKLLPETIRTLADLFLLLIQFFFLF